MANVPQRSKGGQKGIGVVRRRSAIGYITPKDIPSRRHQEIHAERDRKLEEARIQRQILRAILLPLTELSSSANRRDI